MNLYQRAKELRKSMTKAEVILWKHLSNRQLNNYKFRRQSVIKGKYIADFYCPAKRLIIEVDGSIHDNKDIRRKDWIRTRSLNSMGFKVIRFSNAEVINDISYVKIELLRFLESI